MAVEEKKEKELNTPNIGVWIEQLSPIVPKNYLSVAITPPPMPGDPGQPPQMMGTPPVEGTPPPAAPGPGPGQRRGPEEGMRRGGGGPRGGRDRGDRGGGGGGPGGAAELSHLILTCRSVNLNPLSPEANTKLVNSVIEEFVTHTNLFDAMQTRIVGDIAGIDSTNLTISFQIQIKLARPIKL
jgi:hypothetical protein